MESVAVNCTNGLSVLVYWRSVRRDFPNGIRASEPERSASSLRAGPAGGTGHRNPWHLLRDRIRWPRDSNGIVREREVLYTAFLLPAPARAACCTHARKAARFTVVGGADPVRIISPKVSHYWYFSRVDLLFFGGGVSVLVSRECRLGAQSYGNHDRLKEVRRAVQNF